MINYHSDKGRTLKGHRLCGGRGGGSHGSPDTCCGTERRGFSWQSQTLVVGARGGGSHGSPRHWLWGGESGVLMAVPDAGCGGERRLFSWQSQMLVVGGVVGEAGFLMAVSDAGCGGERRGFSRQGQTLVVRRRGGGSHGCPIRWLRGERWGFTWQS